MSKRAEEEQASAILPESIISYANEHTVLAGLVYREGVKFGYEQAEKDLALTWEDVAILITIYEQGVDNGDYRRYNDAEWMKEYSQDILRKFNKIR